LKLPHARQRDERTRDPLPISESLFLSLSLFLRHQSLSSSPLSRDIIRDTDLDSAGEPLKDSSVNRREIVLNHRPPRPGCAGERRDIS